MCDSGGYHYLPSWHNISGKARPGTYHLPHQGAGGSRTALALPHLISKSVSLFIKPYFSYSDTIVCIDIQHIKATQYVGRVVERSCDLSGKD